MSELGVGEWVGAANAAGWNAAKGHHVSRGQWFGAADAASGGACVVMQRLMHQVTERVVSGVVLAGVL